MYASLLAFLTLVPAADPSDLDAKVVASLNAYRQQAGVQPVVLDTTLARDCRAHAEYLLKNLDLLKQGKLNAHDEDPKLPGFSPAGQRAAKTSVIALRFGLKEPPGPIQAIDGWMGTFFHRQPLLSPQTKKIGLGYARGAGDVWITLLDYKTGGDPTASLSQPLIYPVDMQKDVPLAFLGPEHPNPIPQSKDKKAGYPISIAFPPKTLIQGVTATLKDDNGKPVEAWLLTPEKPVVEARYQDHLLGLIAKQPLQPGTTYTVAFQAQVNGKPWERTWRFTTQK